MKSENLFLSCFCIFRDGGGGLIDNNVGYKGSNKSMRNKDNLTAARVNIY